jgi:bifunctional enzyme CysN/CysC
MARNRVGPGEFVEVYVDTSLEVAESRDVKGLYAKARRGELANFTGVDSPYEAPVNPEIHIDTTVTGLEESARQVIVHLHLRDRG